ncbi:MAG: hypothetical protein KC445_07075 [Anaerolineales bacterium]|nr:hypothetical protein [Anaerolineales bacterium]
METRLKGVVVTSVLAGGDGIPRARLYEGEQAFVAALADYYGLTDQYALANGLAALLVSLNAAERAVAQQSEEMWCEWEKQGKVRNGKKGNLRN